MSVKITTDLYIALMMVIALKRDLNLFFVVCDGEDCTILHLIAYEGLDYQHIKVLTMHNLLMRFLSFVRLRCRRKLTAYIVE